MAVCMSSPAKGKKPACLPCPMRYMEPWKRPTAPEYP